MGAVASAPVSETIKHSVTNFERGALLNATEAAAQHPAFQAAWHKVTLASDAGKLRALQEADLLAVDGALL